jgi:hypothetical protein
MVAVSSPLSSLIPLHSNTSWPGPPIRQKQKADDTAKATAAQDGGGIWDGGAPDNRI